MMHPENFPPPARPPFIASVRQSVMAVMASTARRLVLVAVAVLTLGLMHVLQPVSAHAATPPQPAISAFSPPASAPSTSAPPAPAAAQQPRNGYADQLQPRRKTPPMLVNQPYAPIRRSDDQADVPEIEMFVGESRVFPTPGVARIAVGNGQVMTAAALDGRETILFANAVGTSSLFVWSEDGRYQRLKINIVPGDTSRYAREIAAFLAAIPGARASVIGDKVIVEGDGLSDFELLKIDELAKRYPQIVNFTNRLGWEKMILLDVKIAEFPVNELREQGIKWTPTGGGAIAGIWSPLRRGHDGPYQVNIQTSGQGNSAPISMKPGVDGAVSGGVAMPAALNILSGLSLGLNAQLNLLAQNGRASILAEPQLSARNGAKASFLAGGEYPYTVSTINGPTVMFKSYGVKLEIQPRVDSRGTVRAHIDSEASSIDASISTQAGPGLRTRKVSTEFNVASGETIVLSGLLSRETSTDIDKVPLLGDLPVLGALFRSTRFQNKETELVVFVTPTVVDSHTPELAERARRVGEKLSGTMDAPPYLSQPLQPGRDAGSFTPAPAPATPAASMPADGPVSAGGSLLMVTSPQAVLRASPVADSPVLLSLGRGAAVRMGTQPATDGDRSRWRQVMVGEVRGWIAADAVEPVSRVGAGVLRAPPEPAAEHAGPLLGPVSTPLPQAAAAESRLAPRRLRVIAERLALRVTPDINAPMLRQLRAGAVVEALPQAPRGLWTAVQAGEERGWVASQWLLPVEQP
ncbi:pilus assembly protein N-terminal domain-containing protein [Noviherbaspirillum suwonense]|uniref:Pilus assembly protein CpaC n=1 Tax=Noviherbaspirillum suwonense TaxID=1224511 RepID=A0ABY1QE12_9BURK|nr:pilus assembly protein N-terminal domain-containing protein [Noviherbaspirillum suwonense]SMP67755.1 pilus assembly protein CpaC [Noviherbaspirillum suwonense]